MLPPGGKTTPGAAGAKKVMVLQKLFKLRNISRTKQAFIPGLLPRDSVFKVTMDPNSSIRLAPGMCAIFTVSFKTDIFLNQEETMTFKSSSATVTTVKISCFRSPPKLKVYIYKDLLAFSEKLNSFTNENFKDERNIALNSTIDCGSCLIGNSQATTLVLRNDGSSAYFFFVSEEDWYFNSIESITEDMILEFPLFRIFPAYFQIKQNQFVEVVVHFFPNRFGLEVEKLFFLCDNNTVHDIEIIGDGVAFVRDSVVLEVDSPFTQITTTPDDNETLKEPPVPLTIDFGECLKKVPKTRYITVHNNTMVDLYFKWVMRYHNKEADHERLKKISPEMIKIKELTGLLPGNSTSDIPVTFEMQSDKLGRFGVILIYYILDVPEIALGENVKFWVTEQSNSTSSLEDESEEVKRLNLVIGEVELLTTLMPLTVIFDPPHSITSVHLPPDSRCQQWIEISTDWSTPLECVWGPPRRCNIYMEPDRFILEPNSSVWCKMEVYLHNTKTVRDTLKLIINGGSHVRKFKVKIKVKRGMAMFSENSINFGTLYRSVETISETLSIRNTGHEELQFEIFEYYYSFNDERFYEFNSCKHLSVWKGTLGAQQTIPVVYSTNIKASHHKWVSCLVLMSMVPKAVAIDTCLVVYMVSEPTLVIVTTHKFSILCPDHPLYLTVPETFVVTLTNTHDALPGGFIWGIPVGNHAKTLDVKYNPRGGFVKCGESKNVSITLTPLKCGIVDNLFLPCFVGNTTNPLLLTVICAVDNIHVYIYLPMEEQAKEIKILWPPPMISDSYVDMGLRTPDEEEGSVEYQPCDVEDTSDENSIQQPDASYFDSLHCPSLQSIVEYTMKNMMDSSGEEYQVPMTVDWKEQSTFKETKSLTLPSSPSIPLHEAFGSDIFFHDYMIEFRQIPLKTPVKKTILIENVTPVLGHLAIECYNFCGIDDYQDQKSATNILYQLNIRKKDSWEEIIEGDRGLVVKISPPNGSLEMSQFLEVDIWVYANTWGTYLEEVRIELNDVLPFCFNVFVEVVGVPIEFPMAYNSIRSPVLRFGNLAYLSEPVARRLNVKNASCIPISLGWHVFVCKPKSHAERRCKKPFNVVLDTFERPAAPFSAKPPETDFQLMVTPVNYGKEDDEIFQISPRDLRLEPKSSGMVTVILNPQLFDAKYEKTYIEARLIGHLRVEEQHTYQSHLYRRLSGTDIVPAKVKLLATIEMPLLKVELVKGDTRIRAYTNDIIEAQEMKFERVLVFKNYHTASLNIYMHMANPFKVVYLHTKTSHKKKLQIAEIQPQECVEVLVRCTLDTEAVLNYSHMLFSEKETVYTEIPNFSEQSIKIVRSLNIHQRGFKSQLTNLEMILFYPKLMVSPESIDFGAVFTGTTKKALLTISNPTGSTVPFNIQSNSSQYLTIIPSSGCLPKANGTTPSSIIIILYFIPLECKVYQDTLRLVTNMPYYHFLISITGTGSNNEKFFIEGI